MAGLMKIVLSPRNNLITFKGKMWADGRQQTILMGLGEAKKVDGATQGWILLISGNPLATYRIDYSFPNKMDIYLLPLTQHQRKYILEGSLLQNGKVYLYSGDFLVKKGFKLAQCKNELNLDIFVTLCAKVNTWQFKLGSGSPRLQSMQQLQKIILPEQVAVAALKNLRVGERQKSERIWYTVANGQVVVRLECPYDHDVYHLEVKLVQTYIGKFNTGRFERRQRHINILDETDVFVTPNPVKPVNQATSFLKSSTNVKTTIAVLSLPVSESDIKGNIIGSVEYWGCVRLHTRDSYWETFGMTKLLTGLNTLSKDKRTGYFTSAFKSFSVAPCQDCVKATSLVLHELKVIN